MRKEKQIKKRIISIITILCCWLLVIFTIYYCNNLKSCNLSDVSKEYLNDLGVSKYQVEKTASISTLKKIHQKKVTVSKEEIAV